jgi:hypothetical protein
MQWAGLPECTTAPHKRWFSNRSVGRPWRCVHPGARPGRGADDLDRPLVVDLAELADCDGAGTCMLIAAARVTATVTGTTRNPLRLAAPRLTCTACRRHSGC